MHSDQGAQFKSKAFKKLLDDNNVLASYSRPGYPYDNVVTEVFFKYLKGRGINRISCTSLKDIKMACSEYIESFYNNYNPHPTNLNLAPNLKEEEYFKKNIAIFVSNYLTLVHSSLLSVNEDKLSKYATKSLIASCPSLSNVSFKNGW